MASKKKAALVTAWLLLNLLVFWFVGLASSGYSLEGYLPGQGAKAGQYTPIVYAKPNDMPQGILYMVDYDGTIQYYIVWEDEYFSNSVIDKLYRFFRGLVYSGATQDIEVVKVSPKDGSFYFQTKSHVDVHGKLLPGGECLWIERNVTVPNCAENGTHIRVYVVTWNHMLSPVMENGTVKTELRMKHMTPEDYVFLGMFRRTHYSMAGITVNSLTLAIISTLAFNGAIYAAWRKGYLAMESQKRTWMKIRGALGNLMKKLRR